MVAYHDLNEHCSHGMRRAVYRGSVSAGLTHSVGSFVAQAIYYFFLTRPSPVGGFLDYYVFGNLFKKMNNFGTRQEAIIRISALCLLNNYSGLIEVTLQ